MPKKICNFSDCHNIIPGNEKYCEEHKNIAENSQKERHRHYKSKRTDIKEQRFYNSKEWIALTTLMKSKYKGLCLWSYLIEDTIRAADVNHHIVTIKDDWSLRLTIYNIIPLSDSVHKMIHKLYETDKEGTQKILRNLINKWNSFGFKGNE